MKNVGKKIINDISVNDSVVMDVYGKVTIPDEVNFSNALELVQLGYKIARKGWNGKGMFVVYQKAYPEGIPANKNTAEAFGIEEGSLFKCEPYLQIHMVNGSHSMWVPSVNDLFAEDWMIVE